MVVQTKFKQINLQPPGCLYQRQCACNPKADIHAPPHLVRIKNHSGFENLNKVELYKSVDRFTCSNKSILASTQEQEKAGLLLWPQLQMVSLGRFHKYKILSITSCSALSMSVFQETKVQFGQCSKCQASISTPRMAMVGLLSRWPKKLATKPLRSS